MWTWFHRLASPPHFYRLAERWLPWVGVAAAGLLAWGWIGGLVFAPPDYQQKDAFRIIYVHVPTAAASLSLYTMMAVAGAVALIWRMKLAECVLVATAPVGAGMTVVPLYAALAGTFLLCAYAILRRVQNELLWRERRTGWVAELL